MAVDAFVSKYLSPEEKRLSGQYDLADRRIGTSVADFPNHLKALHAGKLAHERHEELLVEAVNVFSSKYN